MWILDVKEDTIKTAVFNFYIVKSDLIQKFKFLFKF